MTRTRKLHELDKQRGMPCSMQDNFSRNNGNFCLSEQARARGTATHQSHFMNSNVDLDQDENPESFIESISLVEKQGSRKMNRAYRVFYHRGEKKRERT